MTSPSRKKRPITARICPAQGRTKLSQSNRAWKRVAFLGAVTLGLAWPNTLVAQQPDGWSPQPYSPPAETTTNAGAIPPNPLRNKSADTGASVVRWRKVDAAPAAAPKSFVPASAQNDESTESSLRTSGGNDNSLSNQTPTNVRSSGLSNSLIRQPKKSNELTLAPAAGPSIAAQPATGWHPANGAVAMQPTNESRVMPAASTTTQPATFAAPRTAATRANSSNTASNSPEQFDAPKRTKLSASQASSRRGYSQPNGVQLASYQQEAEGGIQLPPALLPQNAPNLLPGTPEVQPDPLEPENMPKANQSRSLLDLNQNEPAQPPALDNESAMERMTPPSRSLPPNRSDMNSPSDALLNNRFDDEEPSRTFKRPQGSRTGVNCDTLRQALEESDITKIRVDSSPSFVEGYKNERVSNSKDSFVQSAPSRKWYNMDGQPIGEGRLVDLAYGSVVLETSKGKRTTYLLNKLSEADQVYVSESWGVPITCALGDGSFAAREFVPTTVTWKASGACHKPLYFEEVQLERYGHEWGPWAQPAISSMNFFKNVAVLPYKMGIHPPNECQYSLGYYRPGSCAPWTVGPIPISLRGAAAQAAVVTGAAAALP